MGTMADDGGPGAQLADGPGAPPGGVSRWIDLGGPVHYLDFGGAADGPLIVCVHGLGGAALNWLSLAPLLTPACRVVAPDLAGHGLTQPAGRGAGVAANRLLLHRFLAALPSRPVILLGNSMGGMISLLEAGAAPAAVAGLILLDPALPFVLARPDPLVLATFAGYLLPGLGRLVPAARRPQGPDEVVAGILRLCCADPSRVTADVIARHLELAQQRAAFRGAEQDFLAATRSVVATMGYPGRRDYRRRIRSAGCPVLLIHGTRDRLIPIAAARAAARANPSWTLIQFLGTGHVPQLEAPGETAQAITGWLGSAGRSAASRAAAPGHQPDGLRPAAGAGA
ncbi:MAG: alpha/beta hydrolase [Nocardiopsaceae bacterium]|jgi:pimeloyl-ACP methyl ester carboxylesterase|nr:alpha/beta hydrolase [Nocardiopsaceae bacterium]